MKVCVRSVVAGLLAAWVANSSADVVVSPIRLFNGRDLTGFYTWLRTSQRDDFRGVFSVANGELRVSGDQSGYLATRKEYENYRLVVEYRWGGRTSAIPAAQARDSGVFLHAFGPDGNSVDDDGAFMAAIECDVSEGATGDLTLVRGHLPNRYALSPRLTATVSRETDAAKWPFWRAGGAARTLKDSGRVNWKDKSRSWRDRFDFRGPKDVEKPVGQWNTLECVCSGDIVEVRLNGVVVNKATRVHPSKGKILLQSAGSEIFFRRVDLLPASE